jgi:DNA-binding Lrp family transcriptional regulator
MQFGVAALRNRDSLKAAERVDHLLDATDFQILGQLHRSPLDSTEAIARAIGLTRNAVARRIKNLQSSAVRLRFFAIPHFQLFGARSTVALFPPNPRAKPRDFLNVPQVIAYDVNHDGLLAATYWAFSKEDEKRVPELMEAVSGNPPLALLKEATPGPKTPHLSRLEWKILRALVAEPRASAVALARRTGLTAKTCARHRKALIASHAVLPAMSILEDQSKGFPVYRVYIEGAPSSATLDKILGTDSITTDLVQDGQVRFAHAASFGDVLAAVETVRKAPGVKDLKLILAREAAVATDKFLRLIDAKVESPRTEPRLAVAI